MRFAARGTRAIAPLVGVVAIALASLAASCRGAGGSPLTGLCEGREAAQRVEATVDTILPFAGPALTAIRGQRFALDVTFSPPAPTGPTAGTAECNGAMGEAHFSGDLPQPIRGGTSATGTAGWRIDGDTILVDLNPRARDNNLVMSLPLRGGHGHWALSTFAGETVRGRTDSGR